MSENIYYHGTDTEVRVGDVIDYRTLLFRHLKGRICYVPGQSAINPEFESNGYRQWVIEFPDGRYIARYFEPGTRITKRVQFVRRSDDDYQGVQPDDKVL